MSDFGFYLKKCWSLVFIAAAIIGGFYIDHSIKTDLRNDLVAAERDLKSMQIDIDMSQQRVDDYHGALDDISVFSHFIFAEDEPQKLIDKLNLDAADNNVLLSDVRFDIPEFIKARDNTQSMALMKFQISLIGGYYSLWDFIKTLESRPYLEGIEEMNLSSHNPAGSELKMDLKGTFRVFDRNIVDWFVSDGT